MSLEYIFFLNYDETLFAEYARQSFHYSKEYSSQEGLNDSIEEYAIIVVNTELAPENAVFHLDTDYSGGCACWTTSNIPPSAIVDIFSFSLQ